MGHLFSRAIKRFTQCSNSRNQLPSASGSNEQQQGGGGGGGVVRDQRDEDSERPTVQAIPVGQSIDSSEYAAFKTTQSSFERADERAGQVAPIAEEKPGEDFEAMEDAKENVSREDQDKQPEVEEAVIKIQALVRGHLTRKALKDAQQQAATVPPNALGQSQFDEESLRRPPNAVFTNASPPATPTAVTSPTNQPQPNKPTMNNRVPPLESIVEDVSEAPQCANREQQQWRAPQPPTPDTADSGLGRPTSPGGEANASIDINCATPASASIDIADHHARPPLPIASVLHHRASHAALNQAESQAARRQTSRPLPSLDLHQHHQQELNTGSLPSSPPHISLAASTNSHSHSIDSAEAAAIRIQSAFRGYHTRKHSPYRRRSPANNNNNNNNDNNSNNSNNVNSGPLISGGAHLGLASQQLNGEPTNGTLSTPDGRIRRNHALGATRQNAAILDDDEDDDEGVEGCERLASGGGAVDLPEETTGAPVQPVQPAATIETSAGAAGGASGQGCARVGTNGQKGGEGGRPSRQRHRPDELHTIGDSLDETSVRNALQAAGENNTGNNVTTTTTTTTTTTDDDDDDNNNDQSTVRELSSSFAPPVSQLGGLITAASDGDALGPARQESMADDDRLRAAADARWSNSLDTDSSFLGAALSLNEDLSESVLGESPTGELHQDRASSRPRESIGAAIEALDDSVVDLDGVKSTTSASQQLDELERVTSQLEADLEEATTGRAEATMTHCGPEQLVESLADRLVEEDDEEEEEGQNLNELESDDIERRDPSGADSARSDHPNDQPALAASDSLEEGAAPVERRLDVVSPDEAIGSGESSPVPMALSPSSTAAALEQDDNSSDEGGESDNGGQSPTKMDNDRQGGSPNGASAGGGRSKKRNRKRKGKK